MEATFCTDLLISASRSNVTKNDDTGCSVNTISNSSSVREPERRHIVTETCFVLANRKADWVLKSYPENASVSAQLSTFIPLRRVFMFSSLRSSHYSGPKIPNVPAQILRIGPAHRVNISGTYTANPPLLAKCGFKRQKLAQVSDDESMNCYIRKYARERRFLEDQTETSVLVLYNSRSNY